jgi:hypothetical protein
MHALKEHLHHHLLNLTEKRHVIGGMILLVLLYFGPYLPTWLALTLFLFVTCMAMTTHSDSLKVVLVALVSFLGSIVFLWLKGWKSFSGELLTPQQAPEEAMVLMMLTTLIFGTLSWIKRLLNSRDAKLDKLLEACNLYVWIGGTFAFIYTVVERINTQAFRHVQITSAGSSPRTVVEWRSDVQQMLYYSFETQTTLGFGDMVPVTHIARVLTITQAVIGQFYVAVIMGYVLSLWIHNFGGRLNKDGRRSESKKNNAT